MDEGIRIDLNAADESLVVMVTLEQVQESLWQESDSGIKRSIKASKRMEGILSACENLDKISSRVEAKLYLTTKPLDSGGQSS